MANQATLRVMQELKQLHEHADIGIMVSYDESDLLEVDAVVVGPPNTPYALGFYEFNIKFPPDYPAKPPSVVFRTTNRGHTRFGPNLYATGKVCLSILGTWPGRPEEQWSPVQGLETVLRSIQSLLAENPYTLEPGNEKCADTRESEVYNAKVHHENLRLAVIRPLEEAFGGSDLTLAERSLNTIPRLHKKRPLPRPFIDVLKRRFLWYLESYKMEIEKGRLRRGWSTGSFPVLRFECTGNDMTGHWDYDKLKSQLKNLEDQILAETRNWPRLGIKEASNSEVLAASLRTQYKNIASALGRRTEGMAVVELVEDNPFLWKLTYHGRPMTQFDGGVIKAKIYISPKHPAEQPRVFLEDTLEHVRVTPQKFLLYLPLEAEGMSDHVDGIIRSLEEESPPCDPLMTVNPAASALCWGTPEEKRQYRRNLRRSVEATIG
ncbi:Uncharacterized protein PECH_005186 [Penicillium ucsense]|uniref:Ubiquitin-conjugating enzyme E2 Z n=1 Tax=Penicillium ucsense TaxID=2839758 RepID=A0A8J8W3X4_9EURO|nr:Uncharacterized protein PECM_005406 [Penicillium ucsense]KAF7736558.1 Uncharacterized protein PECH_005186 [Penicillium ucsense]